MTAVAQFHAGAAPAYAGLGIMHDEPGSGWIDWPAASVPVDAEVPGTVRRAIARALVRQGTVTFLVSEPHPAMRLTPVRQNLAARLLRQPLHQGTTRDAAAVEQLFVDPLQGWWLGSAAAIVSDPATDPPHLDAAEWKALVGDQWIGTVRGNPAILAAFRAGVDGEMAGWWSRTARLRDIFAQALVQASVVPDQPAA